jgi:HD-GYP domain-containing protein (c-di-GMP phosphodiesterase class II)
VALVAFQHHERVDGIGCPLGLRGDAILLEARIMAVADVVQTKSSHRPYPASQGIERALAEIERETGRGRRISYDANVADGCLNLFRQRGCVISD